MSAVPRVYLDTNVFIYATEESSDRSGLLAGLFSRSAQAADALILTSELTLAELVVKPLRDQDGQLVTRYETMIRTSTWLTVQPVSRQIIKIAGALRAGTGFKLPDAIHISTAISMKCSHFLTADKSLRRFGGAGSLEFNMPGSRPLAMTPLDIQTLTTLLESLSP